MNIVLDTNVLVSGMLQAHGNPGRIVGQVAVGEITLAFDARVLAEYEEVLHRPRFRLEPFRIHALLDQIRAGGLLVVARPLALQLDDPDDEPFVEVAATARVPYLVTGNLKHFKSVRLPGLEILSPADFAALLSR